MRKAVLTLKPTGGNEMYAYTQRIKTERFPLSQVEATVQNTLDYLDEVHGIRAKGWETTIRALCQRELRDCLVDFGRHASYDFAVADEIGNRVMLVGEEAVELLKIRGR